jgi:capsular exopolysaccharide synthesis family protein
VVEVKNASQAQATTGSLKLFDLRDTSRPVPSPLAELKDRRLIVHADADPVFVEQYRRLGAVLHHGQVQEGTRSIAVASAVGKEGKTLTATNLALMLSRSFKKRVLLVDGDLRKPSVHHVLQIENAAGLTDVLEGRIGLLEAARNLSPTFSVMTAGRHGSDPVALLVSKATGQFLEEALDHFDWLIVDTPPVALFPDAGLFLDKVDRCVMVLRASSTSPAVATKAVAAIGASRIVGIVFNGAEKTEIASGYGYGEYGEK